MRASVVLRVVSRGLCAVAALLASGLALAQPAAKPAGSIYSCTTADGRRLTSDRPIAECSTREQRVLNADGSLRTVVPPAMSPEERAAHEAAERKLAVERAAKADAVRRDRNLMARYRSEAMHQKAREAALDDVNKSMRISEKRIQDLAVERKPLLDEAEFYTGKQLPAKLRLQLDANDASTQAQKELIENQKAELVRVNKLYDVELARLRKLWAGAPPGSID
ncbi:hypothetical protein [Paucibacter soli]|uniref:hypothetical protein n=1 Tax=Paucibacter soli TaxID=3133433 RepID=UPI0030A9C3E3